MSDALLSVAGVSQLASGQTAFAVGISFSANGGRLRSNSFLLDGQDVNDPVLTGMQMPLNNPDAIQEVRIVTNQFLPEYGHNASSVVNFVGKSGTNDLHGSVFWFHNDQFLNACSNLDKGAGFCDANATDKSKQNAPRRLENQMGFTIGGPVMFPRFGEGGGHFFNGKNKTFFFTDYQRWSDRQAILRRHAERRTHGHWSRGIADPRRQSSTGASSPSIRSGRSSEWTKKNGYGRGWPDL